MKQDDNVVSDFVLVCAYMQQMWSCDCFYSLMQKKKKNLKKQSKVSLIRFLLDHECQIYILDYIP
jgi:hypothetical protein